MKRKIVLFLFGMVVAVNFIGCNGKQQAEKFKKQAQVVTEQTMPEATKTSEEAQGKSEEKAEQKQKSVEQEQQTETDSNAKVETKSETKTEVVNKTQTESDKSQADVTIPQTTQTAPTTVPEAPKVETTTPPPEIPRATANDSQAVADKVIEYINTYRSTPAIKLPGLTKYAEYRSRQLISNFAHDTADERTAATALQYGTYIDPPLYGMTGEPYYEAGAREAIAKGGYIGTIDEVAQRLASLVRNSAGHWAYVGSSEYPYIAVGVTYESGMWYCDIAMARENTDNN